MKKAQWGYRVVDRDGYYRIYRVYYDLKKIIMHSDSAPIPGGETVEELRQDIEMMRDALSRPILNAEDLPR